MKRGRWRTFSSACRYLPGNHDAALPRRAKFAGLLAGKTLARCRDALHVCALATGLGDKAVSLVYERVLHRDQSELWMSRCKTQITAVLDLLEADRAGRASAFWFGERIGHADIAVACVTRFAREA